MSETGEHEDKGNVRKYCTLSPPTIRYLEQLVKRGTHGTSVPRVMSSIIEEGVRKAIKDGFIRLEAESQNATDPPPSS